MRITSPEMNDYAVRVGCPPARRRPMMQKVYTGPFHYLIDANNALLVPIDLTLGAALVDQQLLQKLNVGAANDAPYVLQIHAVRAFVQTDRATLLPLERNFAALSGLFLHHQDDEDRFLPLQEAMNLYPGTWTAPLAAAAQGESWGSAGEHQRVGRMYPPWIIDFEADVFEVGSTANLVDGGAAPLNVLLAFYGIAYHNRNLLDVDPCRTSEKELGRPEERTITKYLQAPWMK